MRFVFVLTSVLLGVSVGFSDGKESNKKRDKKPALPVLHLKTERELKLKEPLEAGRPAFISAASGIVKKGEQLFVISDDESFLFSFRPADPYLNPIQLTQKNAAVEKEQRKKTKLDFESLAVLAAEDWPPYGALLAWPSGSTPERMTAMTLPFDEKGALGAPLTSDIAGLAKIFSGSITDLNIEGLLLNDKKAYFFQRGNNNEKSGVFELSLKALVQGLKEGAWGGKVEFQKLKMGKMNSVKLGISDVVTTKLGVLGLATAEDTSSSYADGTVHGTVLVRMSGGKTEILAHFDQILKLEGIAVREESADGKISLYLVDDADDPNKPSRLYSAELTPDLLIQVKK